MNCKYKYNICKRTDCQSELCQGVHDRSKWYQQCPRCYQYIFGNFTQYPKIPSDKFVIPRTWRAERLRRPFVSYQLKNQNSAWVFFTGCSRNACQATPLCSCSFSLPSVSVQVMLSPIWPLVTSCIQGITFILKILLEWRCYAAFSEGLCSMLWSCLSRTM